MTTTVLKEKKRDSSQKISIRYNINQLPSVLHKVGLAGFVNVYNTLKGKGQINGHVHVDGNDVLLDLDSEDVFSIFRYILD